MTYLVVYSYVHYTYYAVFQLLIVYIIETAVTFCTMLYCYNYNKTHAVSEKNEDACGTLKRENASICEQVGICGKQSSRIYFI